jgi:ATP-dependent Clp protease adaptor protein ClpS
VPGAFFFVAVPSTSATARHFFRDMRSGFAEALGLDGWVAEEPGPGSTMSDDDKREGDENVTGVVVRTKPKTKKPSLYKVLMLNDDYTPMEFVVHVLELFFSKNREEAQRIMMHVHRRGVGICGVYTYEVAESKVTQVMDFARQHQHPLQCTLEKE